MPTTLKAYLILCDGNTIFIALNKLLKKKTYIFRYRFNYLIAFYILIFSYPFHYIKSEKLDIDCLLKLRYFI